MASLFASTMNTRAVFPDSLKYIRSDVPDKITEDEKKWLIANKIYNVVDLRTEEERLKRTCPLENDERFRYHCMPVTGGNAVPKNVDDVPKSYIAMVDDNFFRIIDFIEKSETGVLFFCNAGKDRTGVVSAVLIHNAGVYDYIIDDYMESKENLKPMLKEYVQQFPETDIAVITPNVRYITEFLMWFRKMERCKKTGYNKAECESDCSITEIPDNIPLENDTPIYGTKEEKALQCLKKAGWYEGRNVDITEVEEWYARWNITLPEAVKDIFREYYGLAEEWWFKHKENGGYYDFSFFLFSPVTGKHYLDCIDGSGKFEDQFMAENAAGKELVFIGKIGYYEPDFIFADERGNIWNTDGWVYGSIHSLVLHHFYNHDSWSSVKMNRYEEWR
ncbi:MAG: tyrosine-protein phosphatase [Oscillospiraceae bacterium]|nr:tyrosine-protein phosphatase [Oscillospiraceae bacterium]